MKRALSVLTLILISSLLIVSCVGTVNVEKELQGTWRWDTTDEGYGLYTFNDGEFKVDIYFYNTKIGTNTGTYVINEDKELIVLSYNESGEDIKLDYFLNDGKLCLMLNNDILKKQ